MALHFAKLPEASCLSLIVAVHLDGRTNRPLTRLQTIDQGWNRSLVVHVREEDEFLVDEIVITDGMGSRPIEVVLRQPKIGASPCLLHPRGEPLFALVDFILIEGEHDATVVLGAGVAEADTVTLHVGEVLLGLLTCGGTQTYRRGKQDVITSEAIRAL